MTQRLASHSLLGANMYRLDPFTDRFYRTLLMRARIQVTEFSTTTTRTLSLVPLPPKYTPDSDAERAKEDAAGETFEPDIHELRPLESQRESAGLAHDEED